MASITLNMTDDAGFILRLPLAYELCRPPYKYASHLYPIYQQDGYNSNSISPLTSSLRRVLHKIDKVDEYESKLIPLKSKLVQILFESFYTAESEEYKSNTIKAVNSQLTQVYWNPKYTAIPEEYQSNIIKAVNSQLTQVYWLLKYEYPVPEGYNSNNLKPLTSQLKKVTL